MGGHNVTLRPLYLREWPGTQRKRLDGLQGQSGRVQKISPRRDSIPGQSSPQRVVIQTELYRSTNTNTHTYSINGEPANPCPITLYLVHGRIHELRSSMKTYSHIINPMSYISLMMNQSRNMSQKVQCKIMCMVYTYIYSHSDKQVWFDVYRGHSVVLVLHNKLQLKGRQTQLIIEVHKQLITSRATSFGYLYNHHQAHTKRHLAKSCGDYINIIH